jgi:hypothetical protein
MRLPRRKFVQLAAGMATLCAGLRGARALDYPVKPVRVIVPFAAGGSTDTAGRLICRGAGIGPAEPRDRNPMKGAGATL